MFGLGLFIGMLLGAGCLVALALFLKARQPQAPAPAGPSPSDKLANARRYLAVIARSMSLNETQMIANKALKETE